MIFKFNDRAVLLQSQKNFTLQKFPKKSVAIKFSTFVTLLGIIQFFDEVFSAFRP
jgi:hypothetical protein